MHAWVQSNILADHSETTHMNANFRGTSYGRVRPTGVAQTVLKEEMVPRQIVLGKSRVALTKPDWKLTVLIVVKEADPPATLFTMDLSKSRSPSRLVRAQLPNPIPSAIWLLDFPCTAVCCLRKRFDQHAYCDIDEQARDGVGNKSWVACHTASGSEMLGHTPLLWGFPCESHRNGPEWFLNILLIYCN